jgi:S-formylglutathione hydrolase FrmB
VSATRRGLLLAGAGTAVAACGSTAPGSRGRSGQRRDRPGILESGSFVSAARRGRRTGWSISYPSGGRTGLPVLVVLHGLGNSHRTAFAGLDLDGAQARLEARTGARFAIASVDGGTTYWHRHPSGEDAGAMVLEELLPLLRRRGLRTDRVALLGWSMGGYGALRLGAILGPSRCAAVAAESPALWTDGAGASRSGFEDAAEYAAYSVMGHERDLHGIPVRVDCGTDDPFYAATREYVAGFTVRDRPLTRFASGGHDQAYWRRTAPAQLRFVASHLT